MSFYQTAPINPTIGTAFEAFDRFAINPMIPQAGYRPGATGPAHLAGLEGLRMYAAPAHRNYPYGLRGLGQTDVLTQLLQGPVQQAISTVVVAAWPTIQQQFDPYMKPIKYAAYATAALAAVAAGFGYLSWKQAGGRF